MKNIKSHFKFTNQQRNGIFLLIFLIIVIQLVYSFVNFTPKNQPNPTNLEDYEKEIDSLKKVAKENNKPKIYPFNPNYITDYKGYVLGMSNQEIDRLHKFRSKNQWVNSAKEFQQVTKVSDSLLKVISPYFKFPEWVTNPKPRKTFSSKNNIPKTFKEKTDLNVVTASQLQKVYGIGKTLSKRIVDYRTKNNGFIANVELQEVYGLQQEVIERVLQHFTVKTPKTIQKIKLNTATRDQLVLIPYIDYEVAHNILEQRTLRDGFKSYDELLKVEDFPLNKFDIIKLYLTLN
ncbi:ComEA family DNA-binding protein [Mangrovimonas spongiae]|uniref:Helix-hairpin-helix domain-containing protein n=1 Tax=Mangrovimonas spongiae TaxID=2494697 RepID=A0A3R9NWJ2_9FLAO|nr:helix-hairpin-helix domain-containing protein [Mangrovimonas spongiae]RSK39189.1 helix-hairpin-helix domain-containing protein [Mangrovimonas spongiae]